MLSNALKFQKVFDRYAEYDRYFEEFLPTEKDWKKCSKVCDYLKRVKNQNLKGNSFNSTPKLATGRKKFSSFVRDTNIHKSEHTDLDVYLGESLFDENEDKNDASPARFDVLEWWKVNEPKYSSKMAKDILSIPITTFASESTFSAGGRVIDDRRASMKPETVEVLLCAADWVRTRHELKGKVNQTINVSI
ncbi:hypothetical protein LIER_42179 [Lithospermum erythrorhizon]|uniref:HAT C-terminal dimerisation domain-containing protein n=1 Tax=Lithospermum erythrorhizon TaxID=34254 RepID=A0AAV3RP80_LITER